MTDWLVCAMFFAAKIQLLCLDHTIIGRLDLPFQPTAVEMARAANAAYPAAAEHGVWMVRDRADVMKEEHLELGTWQ